MNRALLRLAAVAGVCTFLSFGHGVAIGDCEANEPANTGCAADGTPCTITVDVAKPGKCKSQNVVLTQLRPCICKPNDGTQVTCCDGEAVAEDAASGPMPSAPATIVFDLSSTEPLIASLPQNFGGNSVLVATQGVTITVQLTPSGTPDLDDAVVIAGSGSAPSITLPNGMETGPNTWQFTDAGTVSGFLNRSDGSFFLRAAGEIHNDLFAAQPIQTVGEYTGTIDLATRTARFHASGFDFYPAAPLSVLSEWGLGLLVLCLACAAFVVADRKAMGTVLDGLWMRPMILVKTSVVALGIGGVGLIIAAAAIGSPSTIDVLGTVIAALLLGYAAHLIVINRMERRPVR